MAAKRKTVSRKAKKSTTAKKKATTKKTAAKRKTPARKPAAKRATAKKRTATKTAARKNNSPIRISAPLTKSELFRILAERADIQKKDVQNVFESLAEIVDAHVKKSGPGQFTLPGLLKIVVTKKPATKARKGINPFTGEEMMFKAKPARNVVKVRPLKNLKEMAA